MYRLSHKVINDYKIIAAVINGFIPDDESSHLRICYHSVFTFGIIEKCICFSNTSSVDSLDSF